MNRPNININIITYREGDPTWIDIANDRKLWTSLVYELFHDAKNY